VTDLAVIDAWWRREDPTRAPRFDLAPFPSCPTAIGRLDLAHVPLQRPSSFYAIISGPVSTISNELVLTFGFSSRHKKYLVYYDGPVAEAGICGKADGHPSVGPSFAIVYIRACYAEPLGQGAQWAHVAVHELVHALGAVLPVAPNACPTSAGHVCDSDRDPMSATAALGDPLETMFLDVGRDDYYGHSGSWFDVQDSGWLARLDAPQFPLTVAVAGAQTGLVTSDLPGIECPPACSIPWDSGTRVTLTATSTDRTRFLGWDGACTGTLPCLVTMDAARTMIARFGRAAYRLTVRLRGAGRVTSLPAGIACGRRCSALFPAETSVRLRATPAPSWRLAGSSGACRGRAACVVRATADRSVRATFRRR
jgi:hypothetical protein